MQIVLNKSGECGGCVYFNRTWDHERCKSCERNPQIAQYLKDNKTKPDKNLLPDGVFDETSDSPLGRLAEANKAELGQMGVSPAAVDQMMKRHDLRGPPATRKRS